jgi:DnaJ-class molecular chaperone
MKIKNAMEMDFYELLYITRSASAQEIERAYQLCKTTYQRDSIAHYSLVSESERKSILERIEMAYATLKNPEKRKEYDLKAFKSTEGYEEKAFFRKTTEKILIEDSTDKTNLWRKLKYLLFSPRKK